ncbi:CDGSH iron-sulfur domain-containing protein [Salsuginibacillus kocurii]|uniref:CDGSH iron-sulfur domain-containing protein n=1 Tax=Salsuginibacillus kocurii TaxID=427078 RepID=UPI00037463DA|nr:CDGSH iron-sulfur domain-containing protein [Salsuginibacillus kocurii]
MSNVKIKVMDKGPLMVNGDVEVIDMEGNIFDTKSKIALCRCGESDNKPFCDGTHAGNFEDCARAANLNV